MKPSTRVLLLGVFIALLLSGIGVFLMTTIAAGNAEAARRIATVWGGAMGILVPFIGILWWNARRKGE